MGTCNSEFLLDSGFFKETWVSGARMIACKIYALRAKPGELRALVNDHGALGQVKQMRVNAAGTAHSKPLLPN